MTYGKPLEKIKVKHKTVEQSVAGKKADAPDKKSKKKSEDK